MEEERKLYPLSFAPLQDDYAWGSATYLLADLGYRDSVAKNGWLAANTIGELMDTYIDRVVGDNVYEYFGRQFPVCARLIKVKGKMPLMVHPDDSLAAQRYDFLGKEKFWYVLEAGRDATLSIGFRKDCGVQEFYSDCLENDVDKMLNTIAPHAGQIFHISPGTVHCATGEMLIAEFAESSPLDFCLCSRGNELAEDEFDSELSLAEALDFIDFSAYHHKKGSVMNNADGVESLLQIPQFSVNRITLESPLRIDAEKFGSFSLYCCISGEASVQLVSEGQTAPTDYVVREGESLLVPAECQEFFLIPRSKGTILLEAVVEHRADIDPYINPNVEAELPENE